MNRITTWIVTGFARDLNRPVPIGRGLWIGGACIKLYGAEYL